jgi:RNA polymerase sigma factor (sigma-70 family)
VSNQVAAAKTPHLEIPPLTRNGYVRPPGVTAQILEALALSPAELLGRAGLADEAHPQFLGAEALVHFIRRAAREARGRDRDQLFAILLRRSTVFLRSRIRGFPEAEREDIQQTVFMKLVELLFADDDRGDFAEVKFWVLLDARTTTEIAKARTRQRRLASLDEPMSPDGDSAGSALERLETPQLSPEALAELNDLLAQLDPHLRQVFLMRHQLGLAIGKENRADENPCDPSIAAHFNVSARTVGKWLAKAEATLQTLHKA